MEKIEQKLKEAIDEALELEPINEMSLAWDYRKKNKAYCAWTEGPMKSDNCYFKFYNSDSPDDATKVARIRIDRPYYVGGIHRESNSKGIVEKWVLSDKEKQLLIKLLKTESIDNAGCNKWQDILIRWNRDNFGIPASKTIKGETGGYKAKPGVLKRIH